MTEGPTIIVHNGSRANDGARQHIPDPGFYATVPELLRSSAARYEDREYLVGPDSRLSYSETSARVRNLATHLASNGVGKGTRVGILMGNSPSWAIAFLSAASIGALSVPLSTFYKLPELRKAMRQGDVQVLITRRHIAGRATDVTVRELARSSAHPEDEIFDAELPNLRRILVLDDDAPWGVCVDSTSPGSPELGDIVDAMADDVHPSDLASLILTSGTTGTQKAVVHTQGALVRHSYGLSVFQGIPDGRSTYTGAPFFWIGGLVPGVLAHLHYGGTLLTQERLDPDEMVAFIATERPDVLFGFNLVERLKRSQRFPADDPDWLPAVGAAHKSPEQAALHHNSLGMSETAGAHSGPGDEAGRVLPDELLGSFGKPMPGVEHRIVEPGTTREVGPGETGEICVRGYSLMDSLYKRERDEVFDADGWYHTGDLGFLRDSYLFFTGRSGDMIKTKGANVSPEEVQLALQEDAEVMAAAVFGIDDVDAGQLVVAVVAVREVGSFNEDRMLRELGQRISSYKVPKRVIAVPDLPLLASGKPDRALMRGWFAESA